MNFSLFLVRLKQCKDLRFTLYVHAYRRTGHYTLFIHDDQGGFIVNVKTILICSQSSSPMDELFLWPPLIATCALFLFMDTYEPCRIYAEVPMHFSSRIHCAFYLHICVNSNQVRAANRNLLCKLKPIAQNFSKAH
jgi:hypothetical protein